MLYAVYEWLREAARPAVEVAPPGMEDVVQALKRRKEKTGQPESPWAVAWSLADKRGGKAAETGHYPGDGCLPGRHAVMGLQALRAARAAEAGGPHTVAFRNEEGAA